MDSIHSSWVLPLQKEEVMVMQEFSSKSFLLPAKKKRYEHKQVGEIGSEKGELEEVEEEIYIVLEVT